MKFLKIFFISSIVLTSICYVFVAAVDPYNKLGLNPFGFETKAVDFPRVNKFNQLQYSKKNYEAFILGSSTSHRYHTSVVKKLTGLETYNYAVQSACLDDYVAMLNHILTKFKPKLVIIPLDFFCLNKRFKTDDMFYSSPLKDFLFDQNQKLVSSNHFFNKTYFTLSALVDSLKVIWVNMVGEARHAYVEDGNYFKEKSVRGEVQIVQFHHPPYEIDKNRVKQLTQIRKLSLEHKFKLVLFTSPVAYNHLQKTLNNSELAPQMAEFKKILIEHADYFEDFWTDEIKNFNQTIYFRDSSHPTPLFSEIVMKKVLKTVTQSKSQ